MHGARIGLLRGFVASGAGDLFGRRVVHKALDVGVAIDATEEPAVEGMLQLVLIDEEADLLAVFVGGQGRIAMAGETVGVLDLRGGAGRILQRPAGAKERKRTRSFLMRRSRARRPRWEPVTADRGLGVEKIEQRGESRGSVKRIRRQSEALVRA